MIRYECNRCSRSLSRSCAGQVCDCGGLMILMQSDAIVQPPVPPQEIVGYEYEYYDDTLGRIHCRHVTSQPWEDYSHPGYKHIRTLDLTYMNKPE